MTKVRAPKPLRGTVISKVQAFWSSRIGGSSAIPCERKTRRRSTTSPAGPTSGNSAVQPSPIHCGEEIQGRQVSLEAKARYHTLRGRGRHHPVALRVAGEDVGDVNFDNGLARAAQRIGERQAVVRERPRVDDDGVACGALFFDPVDQLALVVRLQAREPEVELAGTLGEQLFQIGESLRAVDLRLAPPKGAKVRTVQHEDLHAGRTSVSDDSTTDGSTD